MSCCPPESTPYLADTYHAKGHDLTTHEGYHYYTHGDSTTNGLILISDVFGYRSGRMRNIADFYAESGMTVVGTLSTTLLCFSPLS
jgi:dienelactone hydrolase